MERGQGRYTLPPALNRVTPCCTPLGKEPPLPAQGRRGERTSLQSRWIPSSSDTGTPRIRRTFSLYRS